LAIPSPDEFRVISSYGDKPTVRFYSVLVSRAILVLVSIFVNESYTVCQFVWFVRPHLCLAWRPFVVIDETLVGLGPITSLTDRPRI